MHPLELFQLWVHGFEDALLERGYSPKRLRREEQALGGTAQTWRKGQAPSSCGRDLRFRRELQLLGYRA